MIDSVRLGDCMKIMPSMGDQCVEMILTDIPYDVVSRPSGGLRNFDKGNADILAFVIKDFVSEVVRIARGSIYIFCATEQVSEIRMLLVAYGLTTRLGVWEKTNPSPMNGQHLWLSGIETCVFGRKKGAVFNEHCQNTVWRHPTTRKMQGMTPKPVKLFERLIKASSNVGDVVCDPCLGTGTTAIASINTERHFVGIELDEKCYNLSTERIAKTQEGI